MRLSLRHISISGICAVFALLASGCWQTVPAPVAPAPAPLASIPPPRLAVRANPIFRLVIPPRSPDEPTRLVALFVRIENIHDLPLTIRPQRIRLELPDGSRRHALDLPRASAIVQYAVLARPDLYYLDDDAGLPPGGLSYRQRSYWHARLTAELLDDRQLSAGESVEAFIVVDTGRRFVSLQDTVVEIVAEPSERELPPSSVRVLLGAPIQVGP